MVTRHLESAGSFEATFWRSFFNAAALVVLLGWLRGWRALATDLAQRRRDALALGRLLVGDVHRLHGGDHDDHRRQRAGDDGDRAARHRPGGPGRPRPSPGGAHLGGDARRRRRHRLDVRPRGRRRRRPSSGRHRGRARRADRRGDQLDGDPEQPQRRRRPAAGGADRRPAVRRWRLVPWRRRSRPAGPTSRCSRCSASPSWPFPA